MTVTIGRRELLAALGGAVAAWPLAARAQQRERPRRIGVLFSAAADDADYQSWLGAFLQSLAESDWKIGHNVRIDMRWATSALAHTHLHRCRTSVSAQMWLTL
jgi:putative tryptophan/tyrosine transport system substrate-binding protein